MVNDLDRTSTPAGNISDELLSAYLDGEVTPEERTLVERSIASNSDVAWRLGALRQTVAIVGQLPRVPLPRSFTLREADVRPTPRARRDAPRWWQVLLSPVFLRSASAVATVLFLAVLVGNVMLSSLAPAAPTSVSATVVVQAPAAARGMSNMAGAGASTDEGAAAKVAPSTESEVTLPPAEAAPMATTEALVMVAPTPSADAHSTGPAVEPNPTREAVAAGAATLPAAAAAYPATTPTPAPTPTDDAAATRHIAPTPAGTALAEALPMTASTTVSDTQSAPGATTFAETAPAVEIAGEALVMPAPDTVPAPQVATDGRLWLNVAALVLGSLAVLFFVAWQLRLRAVGKNR